MTYVSDRQLAESLIPVRFFWDILWHGLSDRESDDSVVLLGLVRRAEREALTGIDEKRAAKILRRARRVNEAVVKPFMEAETHVAKFGLVTYYVLRRLVDAGRLVIADESALDVVQTALLSPEGTLSEFANIEKIDASAQKQARKVFATLQAEGLFLGIAWDD